MLFPPPFFRPIKCHLFFTDASCIKDIYILKRPNHPLLTLSVLLCWISNKYCVASPTWCFEGSRSTFGPRRCDAHLGRHAPPPRARLRHLSQPSSLLTGLLILALGLRGSGWWGRLPAGWAAAGIHVCVQLFLNLLQVLSSGPTAAHILLCMLGLASFLRLAGGGGGCQRKQIKILLITENVKWCVIFKHTERVLKIKSKDWTAGCVSVKSRSYLWIYPCPDLLFWDIEKHTHPHSSNKLAYLDRWPVSLVTPVSLKSSVCWVSHEGPKKLGRIQHQWQELSTGLQYTVKSLSCDFRAYI